MTKIFLHIGTHKTGTASIQRLMSLRSDDLLKNGVLYPVTGRPSQISGHHRLAWSILGIQGEKDEQCWHDLLAEIQAVAPKSVVISAEGFEVSNSKQVERIHQWFDTFDVEVILYLRNQLGYMISAYKETIKSGRYSQSFPRFLNSRSDRLDYARFIKRWERVFGEENVHVRFFDQVKTDPGLIEDILLGIGVDPQMFQEKQPPRANISPPDEFIVLLRYLNKINAQINFGFLNSLHNGIRKSLLKRKTVESSLGRIIKRVISKKLYDQEDIVWLRNFVQQKNQIFLDEYVALEDHHYFDF